MTRRKQEAATRLADTICWGIAICTAALVCVILFRGMVYSDLFHAVEHRRLGTAQRFTQAAPMTVVQHLQAYFRSDGQQLMEHPLFSYREKRHYQEIKGLLKHIETAYTWGCIGFAGLALSLVYLACTTPQGMWAWCAMATRRAALMLMGVVALTGLAAWDFDTWFVQLHRLIFQDRNWLLPSYAASIQLFPTQYFRDFFCVYLTLTSAMAGLLWGAAWGAALTHRDPRHETPTRKRGAL